MAYLCLVKRAPYPVARRDTSHPYIIYMKRLTPKHKAVLQHSLLTLGLLVGAERAAAQTTEVYRPVLTAMPSLQIAPDARSAALGDQGVATTPDVYAQHWNPAKYAFLPERAGLSLGYTPWLSRLTSGIALMQLGGYYSFGGETPQAVGASLRYFASGTQVRYDAQGNSLGDIRPNEYALDLSYSRALSRSFSLAVALRYMHSALDGSGDQRAGSAFAADVAGYLQRDLRIGTTESLWTLGFNLSNIGTKMSFDDGLTSSFIPTKLSLGTGLTYPIDQVHSLALHIEASKLLVPSPIMGDDAAARQRYYDTSSIAGIFRSLSDAPDGLKEELHEVRWALGAEYSFDKRFYVRLGYSYLHPTKGNLQALTTGVGLRLKAFRLDASYLISTIKHNPLDQTFRLSLGLDYEGLRELLK